LTVADGALRDCEGKNRHATCKARLSATSKYFRRHSTIACPGLCARIETCPCTRLPAHEGAKAKAIETCFLLLASRLITFLNGYIKRFLLFQVNEAIWMIKFCCQHTSPQVTVACLPRESNVSGSMPLIIENRIICMFSAASDGAYCPV
jgi:hypothetical protein